MSESFRDLPLAELERLLKLAKASGFQRRASGSQPIGAVARDQPLSLSYAQQRLWFLAQMPGVSQAYHIASGLRLEGELDRPALRRALDRIIARHEALRTTFNATEGQPVQQIAAEGSGFYCAEHDLSEHADARRELEQLASQEASAEFDLATGPLIRGRLIRMAAAEHVLLVTMHHIVSDGWSMGILVKELTALYEAYRSGGSDPLPALPIQYADYAAWQRRWLAGDVLKEQVAYWERTLAGAPMLLELPADRPRPAQQDHGGAMVAIELEPTLTAKLKALGQRQGATTFVILLSAWAALLARLGNVEQLMVGVPVANRARAEVEGLIGLFVNTLALRLDVSGHPTVSELLQRVKGQVVEAQRHQDLPFERVVEIARPPRSLAHSPLFQVMFAWQSDPPATLDLAGLRLSSMSAPGSLAKLDLTLTLAEVGSRIVGGLEYATALFDRATIERYVGYLRALLEGMTQDAPHDVAQNVAPDARQVDRIPLLGEAERRQLLVTWNATDAHYPRERCVHELFEDCAAANPSAIALVAQGRELTYGELNGRANRLAHHLRSLGVGPDARVALCIERSAEMVVALLATLKAGGAYVPLDPAYPTERLRFMLDDSAPLCVLIHESTESRLRAASSPRQQAMTLIDVQGDAARWASLSHTNPERDATRLRPEHLAYVIYTSGSTGIPKGVAVEHRGLTNYCCWAMAAYGPAHAGAVVSSSLSFDATITSLLTPLLCGGRVRLLPEGQELDQLRAVVSAEPGCGLLKITPAHLDALGRLLLAEGARSTASLLVVGGEALTHSTIERWRRLQPGARIVNEYGPTETVVGCVAYDVPVDPDRSRPVAIGRPIANTRIYILDSQGQPAPIGVLGQIYIAGDGVARGYLNRPELTAERFPTDPFAGAADARMYATGDLGRYLPDGNIEFLGRNDFQVKIRGFRIELGEVEARLAEHPALGEVVVLAREDDPGERRLVAYYTLAATPAPPAWQGPSEPAPASPDVHVTPEALRAHLASRLPDYMLPAAYVCLDALPLTPNGKLDRQALPAPGAAAYGGREYEAPLGNVESMLASLWAELLHVERVGRRDNFFELGGHSLLAVSLVERMRQAGLHADVRTLFATPTLAALAVEAVAADDVAADTIAPSYGGNAVEAPPNMIPPGADRITPEMLPLVELSASDLASVVRRVPGGASNVQDIYPLAPLQAGILFHHLAGSEGDPYVSSAQLGFDTRARLDAYLDALQAVIDRHDVLRTAVLWEGLPEPVQVVWRKAPLAVEAIELDPAGGDIAEQLASRFDPRHFRLDVARAPLLRAFVAHDAVNERWVLLLLFHHLVSDHATLTVVHGEIQAHLRGRERELPAPLPYRDFVHRARRGMTEQEHEAFFRHMLGDVDAPTAPLGLTDVQGDGSALLEAHQRVDPLLAGRLRKRARALGVSAASLCHVAWAQVLARLAGQDDVVFGTVLFGRMDSGRGADRVLGMFINTLPLRIRIADDGVEDTVRHTHRLLADLLRHEHASLALAQRCSSVAAPTPLFTTLLNYRHTPHRDPPQALTQAEEGIEFLGGAERSNYPLTFSVDDLGGDFSLSAQVQAPIEPERICAFMHTALEQLVDALERAPATPARSLDVMPRAERQRLLVDWNATDADYPKDRCVHELFEAQAAERPHAVAVEQHGRQLTYAELDARANQLARHLRALGVKPEARVALCLERGLDLVVCLLAVLKAGGAYVPIDPSYPLERRVFLIEDSAPVVVLTAGRGGALQPLRAALANVPGAVVIDLDHDAARWELEPDTAPGRHSTGVSTENLAYVIYTSGSTGRPKGVMVEHRNLSNLIGWHCAAFGAAPGRRSSSVAGVGFDAAAWEVWPSLCSGGTLLLAPADLTRNPEALLAWWRAQGLDVSFLPTPIAELAWADGACPRQLETLLVGGDRMRQRPRAGHAFSLVNNYGPTEATVVATSGRLDASDPVMHIGRPIANTRIYLLDAQQRPVPVGATGRLAIGGAGVARGYMNLPALTAERFVNDPFAEQAGARMYDTGDLARYLPDGNVEFLGRSDFQVKIRGFRIELGEIEARLVEHPALAAAVVLAREDEAGNPRLVAYYTLAAVQAASTEVRTAAGLEPHTERSSSDHDPGVSAEALRAHLATSLPDYMLPVAYVPLRALPLTANGKLDRRALPDPKDSVYPGVYAAGTYEAPLGDIEVALARLWAELLGLERIGRHDSFFALGGHSILATTLTSRVRQELQAELSLRTVFEATDLADLARKIEQMIHGESALNESPPPVDLDARATLPPEIRPMLPARERSRQTPSGVLLTGVTGFLGSFLLHELLAQTDARVFCLVRAESDADARRRLHQSLERYGLLGPDCLSRVEAVAGDLERPRFGLTPRAFRALADQVDAIYHSAALVSFVHSYQMLEATNVLGTQEVLRLACEGHLKPVHHVSTLSVFPHGSPGTARRYREDDDLDELRHELTDSYAQSKWVAEKLVRIAGARGVPVSVYRMGRIGAHSRTGVWNPDDFGCRMIRASLSAGILPTGDWIVETIPVDYVSGAIVHLSRNAGGSGKVYHLVNPSHITADDFTRHLRNVGYPVEQASPSVWRDALTRAAQGDPKHPLYAVAPLLLAEAERHSASEQHFTTDAPAQHHTEFDCTNTSRGLEGSDLTCPPSDERTVTAALAHLVRIGAIEAPSHSSERMTPSSKLAWNRP